MSACVASVEGLQGALILGALGGFVLGVAWHWFCDRPRRLGPADCEGDGA